MQHSIHTAARHRRRSTIRQWGRRGRTVALAAAVGVAGLATAGALELRPSGAISHVQAAGSVVAAGDAAFFGEATGNAVTGVARTSSGNGYWLATNKGTVFAFGDAPFAGSLPAGTSTTIVDIAAAPDGQGYWLVGADGALFAFGSAEFLGSTGGGVLNQPIVGMAATPTGEGYWMVGRDGGIFAFGDAVFHGSTGAIKLNQPIVGMASTASGSGYWLAARDGGIFAFGDAPFRGSASGLRLSEPIVGMASTPSGDGYWLAGRGGGVYTYGDAVFHGSLAGTGRGPIVDIESASAGSGHWIATGGRYLGDFELTCYALRGITASGKPVSRQGVAVDPRVIPLGTEIYIAGEGTRTAIDTGGLIKGNRIDIWRPTSEECRNFGRQTMPVFLPT